VPLAYVTRLMTCEAGVSAMYGSAGPRRLSLGVAMVEAVLAHDRLDALLHHEVGADAAQRSRRVVLTTGPVGEALGVRPEQAEVDGAVRRNAPRDAALWPTKLRPQPKAGGTRRRLRAWLRVGVDRREGMTAAVQYKAAPERAARHAESQLVEDLAAADLAHLAGVDAADLHARVLAVGLPVAQPPRRPAARIGDVVGQQLHRAGDRGALRAAGDRRAALERHRRARRQQRGRSPGRRARAGTDG